MENRKEFAIRITAMGTVNIVMIASFEGDIRNLVGGQVKTLPVTDFIVGDPLVIACDAEGKSKRRPYNYLASVFCGEKIYGDVALLPVEEAGSVRYAGLFSYVVAETLCSCVNIAQYVLSQAPAGSGKSLAEKLVEVPA